LGSATPPPPLELLLEVEPLDDVVLLELLDVELLDVELLDDVVAPELLEVELLDDAAPPVPPAPPVPSGVEPQPRATRDATAEPTRTKYFMCEPLPRKASPGQRVEFSGLPGMTAWVTFAVVGGQLPSGAGLAPGAQPLRLGLRGIAENRSDLRNLRRVRGLP
jgi:hypothetical protein